MVRRRGRAQSGMVTAETAAALPALVLVLAVGVAAVSAVAAHLACVDAARAGARAHARGDDAGSVLAVIAEAAPPGADADVAHHGDRVRVEVTAAVPLVPGTGAVPITVGSRATAPLEAVPP
ncbi:TadE family type IV pilus minor pilin [Nocardiopsis coralliicola]